MVRSSQVTLSKRGLERAKFHPWVYRSDVASVPDTAGLYPVQNPKGGVLGWAAVNPASEITVRFVQRGPNPPDLRDLLQRAIAHRERLGVRAGSYRVVHSDADHLPGFTVDKYGPYLVVQQNSAALEPHLDTLLETLVAHYDPAGVLLRFDSKARALEGLASFKDVAHGDVPDWIEASEDSAQTPVRYLVDAWNGQKTGAFLDQRENRAALARYAHGHALDVFSYHASFGLHLAPHCQAVTCIDASQAALDRAQENAALNHAPNMGFVCANAFEHLRQPGAGQYQTISLDPPALAKARKDVGNAYRAYKELNLRCLKLLSPGGILGTASCSFHLNEQDFYAMLEEASQDAGRSVRVLERRHQAACHPERLGLPESRYLKYAILEVLE